MRFVYLAALLGASGCLCLLDARWRLFFWRAPVRAAVVTVVVTVFLLLWDAAGIAAGIFLRGHSPLTTGVQLAPQLALEEPVFLAFLVYLVAILLFGVRRMLDARRSPGERGR
ncbi:lycopene cyclase domain-containing protein [Humibacter ginsenosidimutans]|uniref:Lycopene cyclase domain-containing protein n=1 Tax=Humibacter ginsenosidimutans TaxID=2599293 RepID=A0A5B8M4V6_9MICO|nr:lycopene cyclase domain-containing protein [Humibacter ginsenosidimutans]QDZ15627.1 lycopene cyclase domain-containing protein [Humibacter ginsenosidimutans]